MSTNVFFNQAMVRTWSCRYDFMHNKQSFLFSVGPDRSRSWYVCCTRPKKKEVKHLTEGNWSVVYSAFTQSHLHGLSELNLSVRSSFQKLINSNTFNGSKDWPSSPFWHFWKRTSISVIAATLQLPSPSGGRQRFLWSRQQSRFLRMCLSK